MRNFLLLFVILFSVGCTRVEPGYVGIRVNLYGSQRGIEDFPIETGRVWYNPWSEDIYEFPVYMQSITWTKDVTEGSPNDDSITFNSKEGAVCNADISIAYALEDTKIPILFVELRKDINYITNVYLRSKVRDSFNRHASVMPVTSIFGDGKQELLIKVRTDLQTELGPKGFKFDLVSFVGGLRVDKSVEAAINATISATQDAIKAENKVKQFEAEARQEVARAEGEAKSNIARAEGEAKAILAKAQAQAEANKILNESLTPVLVEYEYARNWDGKAPQVIGAATPFFNVQKESK